MKYLFLLLGLQACIPLFGQALYDINTIQKIEITFAQSNWDQLLDTEKAGNDGYIMAQSLTINGVLFDSVGVKYKGNSTYNANQTKNPFHIELDTYKEQDYEGYTDLKLSNAAKDPSFLREVLSYQILRQYMDAPLSNYANVYVNGNLIGLYSNSEAISKKFVKSRFYSNDNAFFKCNPPGGAGPQASDFPNLIYKGTDSLSYYDAYELKSESGWQELIDLCDTLNNHPSDIESILDVDRVLWMLAFDNALVNLDSYIGSFKQNYYLYRDDNQRFVPVVWDLNESFGRFALTASGPLNNTTSKQQMSHLLNQNDADFPLVQQLLNIPMYKRMYLAHYKTILLENFDDGSYYINGQSIQSIIDTAVQADINKFFSYNNFLSNLTSDVSGGGGPGGGSTPGITNLMDARTTYLLSLSDFTQSEPLISNINLSNPNPAFNETLTIQAELSNETACYLGYRFDVAAPFKRVIMYDDGAHNDGANNDGIYGAEISLQGSFAQYYLYAENSQAGIFSPRRAEHEFYSITASAAGDLVINEFMASNDQSVADQDGEFDDWIELYNNGSDLINLEGLYLSDDEADLMKWAFPAGSSINGYDYLIIWADNDENQSGLHSSFKLSASGEILLLSDSAGNVLDQIDFPAQSTDLSYARIPNGTGGFQINAPTFQAENISSTPIEDILPSGIQLKAYPNPAREFVVLELEGSYAPDIPLKVYHLDGRLVYQDVISESLTIQTRSWAAGIYIIRVEDVFVKLLVR